METIERERVALEDLAACEGYGVYGPRSRIGVVEEVRRGRRDGRPKLLLVRAGLLGSWRVHAPVDQVDGIDHGAGRIDLRSGGLLAGPRRA